MQCEFLGTGCKREMKELQKNYIYYKNLANEYQGSCIPKSVIEDKLNELKECNTSCLVEQIYNNGKKALCKELLNKGE